MDGTLIRGKKNQKVTSNRENLGLEWAIKEMERELVPGLWINGGEMMKRSFFSETDGEGEEDFRVFAWRGNWNIFTAHTRVI